MLLLVQIFFSCVENLLFSNLTFSDPLETSLPQLWTIPLGRNKGRELNFTVPGELRYIIAIAVSWVSSSWAVQMYQYKTWYYEKIITRRISSAFTTGSCRYQLLFSCGGIMVVLERRGDMVSRDSDWSAREQQAIGPCPDPSKSCWNILLSFTKSEWRPQPGTLSLKSTVFAADKETRRSREGLPAECWEVSEPRKATGTSPWALSREMGERELRWVSAGEPRPEGDWSNDLFESQYPFALA